MPKPTRPNNALEPAVPPRQARSRDTQRRIVEAAAQLLTEHAFTDIRVADIASESSSSVGAFYARFRDKDGLLDHLSGAADLEIQQELDRFADSTAGGDLASVVNGAVALLVRHHRRHHGLLRAVMMRERSAAVAASDLESVTRHLAAAVLVHRREIAHEDPQLAAHLGLHVVTAGIREHVVFAESAGGRSNVTDAILIRELARVYFNYLAS